MAVDADISKSPIVIRNIFDDKTYQEILDYMNNIIPFIPSDMDEVTFLREYRHNPPFFVDIHQQLKDFASEIFNESVKPSYCFLSMYKNGGTCPLHMDRPQCRYTLDYLIKINSKESWPIKIAEELTDEQVRSVNSKWPEEPDDISSIINNNNWTEVNLNPNDCVAYSGTNSWHYRPKILNGEADLIFFHFVPEGFDGPLC